MTSTPASQLEYSFNLQGYETGWSDWASATTKDYADLRGGSYIFRVKARDQAGNADPTPAETAFYVSWAFAVLTDLHIGREFGDYDGPGWNDSGTPVSGDAAGYAQDAVNEINKLADSQNIAFVAVLGDITDQAELSELRAAKLIFDNLTVPWIPIIGNHDGWPMTDNDRGSRLLSSSRLLLRRHNGARVFQSGFGNERLGEGIPRARLRP